MESFEMDDLSPTERLHQKLQENAQNIQGLIGDRTNQIVLNDALFFVTAATNPEAVIKRESMQHDTVGAWNLLISDPKHYAYKVRDEVSAIIAEDAGKDLTYGKEILSLILMGNNTFVEASAGLAGESMYKTWLLNLVPGAQKEYMFYEREKRFMENAVKAKKEGDSNETTINDANKPSLLKKGIDVIKRFFNR